MKEIEHRGHIITQASNCDITIRENGLLKFHAIYNKELSEDELKTYADDVFEFIENNVRHLKGDFQHEY